MKGVIERNIVPIGIISILGFVIVPKVLEALNLKDTKEEKKAKEVEKDLESEKGWTGSIFDKFYWKFLGDEAKKKYNKNIYLPRSNVADTIAKTIKEAYSFWKPYDKYDEQKIYGLISSFSSQAHLSKAIEHYSNKYKKNFYTEIQSMLNPEELIRAVNMAKALPKYITVSK